MYKEIAYILAEQYQRVNGMSSTIVKNVCT
jgi:hypothetical protein